MKENNLIEIIGYVKASKYRGKTLKFIADGTKMPSEIAKELNVGTSQASNILRSLKKFDLVYCTNDSNKKGRLYKNRDIALEILKYLD